MGVLMAKPSSDFRGAAAMTTAGTVDATDSSLMRPVAGRENGGAQKNAPIP
jgi:hypothetical protein